MKRVSWMFAALLLLAGWSSAAPKSKKKKPAAAKAKPEAAATAPVKPPEPPPPPPADSDLADFGAEVEEGDAGLTVSGVLGDSHASELPLRAGDGLEDLNGAPVKTRAQAAAAWRALAPQARASAVATRELSTEHLEGDAPEREAEFKRPSPLALSAQEKIFRDKRLSEAGSAAEAEIKKGLTDFVISAKQSAWIKFPKGIPGEAKPGDVIEALTTTPVMADADLDFVALPAGSRLWAEIIDAKGPAQTRNLRLLFFKLQPLGRGYYPVSGMVTEISGDQRLAKASAGGTVVLPPDASLDPDMMVRIEFLEPIVLTEPASYFQAGPGLWLQSDAKGYKAAKVVPGRSAEKAGIAVGDPVITINGRNIERYDFSEAISMLYGNQGEPVKVGISRAKGGKLETFELSRGTAYKDGKPLPAARPALIAAGPAPAPAPKAALSTDADKALDTVLKAEESPKEAAQKPKISPKKR